MLADLEDTIVALATPLAPGLRGIVRMSGSNAWSVAAQFLSNTTDKNVHPTGHLIGASTDKNVHPTTAAASQEKPRERLLQQVDLVLPGLHSTLPADVCYWPAPRTYTGQDVVEIHTISSPPLLELLVAQCLQAGARAARPGEFTLRAFLAGKLDLTQAEAVLGVIEAEDRADLQQALAQLAGGVAGPLHELRDDLLNLLADVEAGLDFTEEDIQFVHERELLERVTKGLALVTLVQKQLDRRAAAPRPFRVVLAGPPNAGKSSLFNALAGRDAALVSSQPGTTRDYLEANITTPAASGSGAGVITIQLVDTAGLRSAEHAIESASQSLGRDQVSSSDLVLWCQESGGPQEDWREWLPSVAIERVLRISTKCDQGPTTEGTLGTSAWTGIGVEELKRTLTEWARSKKEPPLAPSLSRCRNHVAACLAHLRKAHRQVLEQEPPELLAAELRAALEELGAMVGAVYTEDLLERIFSRFCIGK
ncbi:MAG: tRNA modification GTPase [Gemmataceae bacterium]|nr:tRNA modification GTPase [Gemmataceae bacterium]